MSRFNQFTGSAGALKVSGSDTPEGQAVLARVEPLVNSWVARCRLLAKGSGMNYIAKHLNTPLVSATWMWNSGNETLTVQVFPTFDKPVPSPEAPPPEPKEEPFEPPGHPEPPEPDMPTPVQIKEIQIENELPPLPPQLIKTLVVLFDNEYFVVYDMRSLEKGLGRQKPLIKVSKSQGNWALPGHVLVRRLRDYYFGNMNHSRYAASRADFPVHQCLQMTNNLDMGAISAASVSFSGGVFAYATTFQLYRLKSGLKSTNSLSLQTCIGDVGATAFPALNANATTVWACREEFTLNDDTKNLELSGSDIWTDINSFDIESDFNLPNPIKISPNFIDNDGKAYFDIGWPEGEIMPSMGAFLYCGYSSDPDTPFNYSFSVDGLGGVSGFVNLAKFTQTGGVDKLEQVKTQITSSMGGDFNYDWTVSINSYSATWPSIPSDLVAPYLGIALVPYHESGAAAYYSPRGNGDRHLETSFGPEQNADPGPFYSTAWPCFWEAYTPLMHVSNGEHVISAFNIHEAAYNGSTGSWDLGTNYFFLNGTDFTAELETACETTKDKIQVIFMDVPLYSAQTIKLAPRT